MLTFLMFRGDKIACWFGWRSDTLAPGPPELLRLLHRPHRRSPGKFSLSIGAVALL